MAHWVKRGSEGPFEIIWRKWDLEGRKAYSPSQAMCVSLNFIVRLALLRTGGKLVNINFGWEKFSLLHENLF